MTKPPVKIIEPIDADLNEVADSMFPVHKKRYYVSFWPKKPSGDIKGNCWYEVDLDATSSEEARRLALKLVLDQSPPDADEVNRCRIDVLELLPGQPRPRAVRN